MKKFSIFLVFLSLLICLVSCKPKEYTVTLKVDGEIYESCVVKEEEKLTLPTPSKDGYTFVGWDSGEEVLTGEQSFAADTTLDAVFNINKYTYKFIVEGVVVKEETLDYGSEIVYPENPVKENTQENTYVFKGWDNNATTLLKNEEFNAEFTSTTNVYTYKFLNENGSVIKEETVEYGSQIVYPENPTKAATKEYTYTFAGWDNDATIVTDNITFKATFSKVKNQYTYKFVNYDGEVLKEETVDYGTMPVAPSDPTKEATQEFEYKFAGWDKTLAKVTDDVVYTAVYDEIEIKEEITSLEGLKISFLGDSISTFYAEGSEMNSYYSGNNEFFYPRYSHSIKTVDLTWWCKLIKNNNMVLGVNNSWSGSQACGTGNSAGQSDYRINTIDENGDPDIVIVYLGTNDLGSGRSIADLEKAINTIITKVKARCDAQIFLTTLGYSAYSGGTYTDANRVAYNAKLREIASQKECGIVPLDEYVIDDNYMIYLEDSLHYNAKGANLLSLIAEKAIKDHYNISFDKEIVVEHQEPLPEGAIGMVTCTADSNFWGAYETEVFLASSSFTNPTFSLRIELTKNAENGKYYVTKIQESGTSSSYSCDLVIVVSDSHADSKAIKTALKNVTVGCIADFDETQEFPITILFKENDGGSVTPPTEEPSEPEKPSTPSVEGQLHVGSYNTGVWDPNAYEKAAIIYSADTMDTASTFINYYVIKLKLDSATGKYEIVGLKTVDVACTFGDCDYYVLIYRELADKTYFENASLGGYVIINGDVTSGSCNLKFE